MKNMRNRCRRAHEATMRLDGFDLPPDMTEALVSARLAINNLTERSNAIIIDLMVARARNPQGGAW
jgi:hypothetical protein